MSYLLIKCGSSTMEIIPEKFFPTTQAKLNKLINIISSDSDRPEEHLGQIRDAIQERLNWIQKKRSQYCYMDEKPAEDCEIDKFYTDLQHKAVSRTMDLIVKTQERLSKNYEIVSGLCQDKE